jgi:hypothetical protein
MRVLLTICISVAILFAGCDTKPDTCTDQSAWRLRIGFYSATVNPNYTTIKDSIPRSFSAQSDTTTALPLLQNSDTSKFSISINGKQNAVLYVVYKHYRVFENYTCGFRTNFVLDTVYTDHQVCDSIIIVQPNITNANQENCRFYLNRDTTRYL